MEYVARRQLETKYEIKFVRNSRTKYGFYKWVGDNVIFTECKVFSDDKTTLFINLETKKYEEKYNEYLDSKI